MNTIYPANMNVNTMTGHLTTSQTVITTTKTLNKIFTFAYNFLNKKVTFILHDPHGFDAQK